MIAKVLSVFLQDVACDIVCHAVVVSLRRPKCFAAVVVGIALHSPTAHHPQRPQTSERVGCVRLGRSIPKFVVVRLWEQFGGGGGVPWLHIG